ncbi:hypothetical protein BJ508DRAFT_208397 [Ascobolus immersus RN42]|uniref:WHI2-like protein P4H10.16c n=1 Tax=Ascobolus immersus RN42 TaxID=1160509 RepID=A0A3N4I9S2_ASCIM|nr:hypothetical protein BJ508DRAFT_208397 [Ascobolus immersus RN42]
MSGGAASVITQVSQGGPGVMLPSDLQFETENLTLDLRGTKFVIPREELLTLPEFVLLSLFPNGLFPDSGQVVPGQEPGGDIYTVDFDPVCLEYMLGFFRNVSATIPTSPVEPTEESLEQNSAQGMLQDRAGIIVLREDLDFYVIPPYKDISYEQMIEVKRAASKQLLKQNGIFSGLKRSDDAGTTEQHLIEMLTAGGFDAEDTWGHRATEPGKAVICSLALARLRTDPRPGKDSTSVGMAQKLLLFWRKPARRCWWEGMTLENVDGVDGKLKVWIRRVWTLEMVCICRDSDEGGGMRRVERDGTRRGSLSHTPSTASLCTSGSSSVGSEEEREAEEWMRTRGCGEGDG